MTQIAEILQNNELFHYITAENLINNKSSTTNSTGYVDDRNHVSSSNVTSLYKLRAIKSHVLMISKTKYKDIITKFTSTTTVITFDNG